MAPPFRHFSVHHPLTGDGETIEFDWGGCLLTDRGSADDIDALIDQEAHWLGRPGIVESLRLVEGVVPWPGSPFPRPVYRARWTPLP